MGTQVLRQNSSQQVKDMLRDAIRVLCANTVHYNSRLSIEALIGVTVDCSEVLLINIQETVDVASSVDLEEKNDTVSCEPVVVEDDNNSVDAAEFDNGALVVRDPVQNLQYYDSTEAAVTDEMLKYPSVDGMAVKSEPASYAGACEDVKSTYELVDELLMSASNVISPGDDYFVSGQPSDSSCYSTMSNDPLVATNPSVSSTLRSRATRSLGATSVPHRPNVYTCRPCKKTFNSLTVFTRHKKKHQAQQGAVQRGMQQMEFKLPALPQAHSSTRATVQQTSPCQSYNMGPAMLHSGYDSVASGGDNTTGTDDWTSGRRRSGSGVSSGEVAHVTVYTCNICGQSIRHLSSFMRHKKQHDGVVFRCDICGIVTSRRDALQVHRRKCVLKLQMQTAEGQV